MSNPASVTPALDTVKMKGQYDKAKNRLFLFDYDGTLTNIVQDPATAIPSKRLLKTLNALVLDDRNHVWIISGRNQIFLDTYLSQIKGLGLSAEHGCFLRYPGKDMWDDLAAEVDMGWRSVVKDIFLGYTEDTPGSWLEEKTVALTWHYRMANPDLGAKQALKCKQLLEMTVADDWEVEVMSGKMNIEVRPRFVNKGFIATKLTTEKAGKQEIPDFVLCLGDDSTDEGTVSNILNLLTKANSWWQITDMFRVLRSSTIEQARIFSCTIGAANKETEATYHLSEPDQVLAALEALVGKV